MRHLERLIPLPRPTPPISMSPLPASLTLTQPTPLESNIDFVSGDPPTGTRSLSDIEEYRPCSTASWSLAGPTLPSTRMTTQMVVVSQRPWNLFPSPLVPSWTILRRRRRTRRSHRLVSGMPLSPLESDSLVMSKWKNKARTQRPLALVPIEIACARCAFARLLPLPQLVDHPIVYLPLASGGRGKLGMTRKASLELPEPIKSPPTITYLPKFRTDELALHTCTPFRMLIGFVYMSLSYTASDSTLPEITSQARRCSTHPTIHCVNILVNRYNVDPPRRFVSPTY